MRLCIIGTGYVGLVSGVCFASIGHNVTCIDKNPNIINKLEQGEVHIFEPGLAELLKHNQDRLSFSSNLAANVADADIVFIAVGTPHNDEFGGADLSYVYAAAQEIAPHLNKNAVVVTKSTVPVGTGKMIKQILAENGCPQGISVASNPEFLREGAAIEDFLQPDRVLIGVDSQNAEAKLKELYQPITAKGISLVVTGIQTAELSKYAANAYLATRISFINEIADMCELYDANIEKLANAIGLDNRIGTRYLTPGPGYGGSCFPKDTKALQKMAQNVGLESNILSSVINFNENRHNSLANKVEKYIGNIQGKTVTVLGLAFKAATDDVRYSPALSLVAGLIKAGAKVKAYDPEANSNFSESLKQDYSTNDSDIEYFTNYKDAITNSDAAIIATEWPEFSQLDFSHLKQAMAKPVLIDLRLTYTREQMASEGIEYYSLGRSIK